MQWRKDDAALATALDHYHKLGSYPKAIHRLWRERKLSGDTKHRTSKYLNNIIEADHGGIKRVLRPTRGFQTMKTAYATIKGFEVMRMIRRRKHILCRPRLLAKSCLLTP
jgi:IS6 family transposase